MKKIALLVLLFGALQSNAQTLIKSSTSIEGGVFSLGFDLHDKTYGDRLNIDQTIYWRRRYSDESKEKTVYNFNSLYKRDSIIGVCLYGIDIDMMAEAFETRKANTFRYWNKLRLGGALLLEKNPKWPDYSLEECYNYFNAEIYISYQHIPHSARGDRTTKVRRGSYMFFALATPTKKFDVYFKVKPIGSTWVKCYYYREYDMSRVGISFEIEAKARGYDKIIVASSKDAYRGPTFILGPEYNLNTSQITLRLGIKWDLRNH